VVEHPGGEGHVLALLVLCEGGVPRAIEPEAAAQHVGVGEEIEVIPEGIVRKLLAAALDGELVPEEDVLASPDELFGELIVDPIERDVPEAVVDRLRNEQGWRGTHTRGPGDLDEDHAVDPVRVIRGQRVADDVSGRLVYLLEGDDLDPAGPFPLQVN
jgi:hypothetical protein